MNPQETFTNLLLHASVFSILAFPAKTGRLNVLMINEAMLFLYT